MVLRNQRLKTRATDGWCSCVRASVKAGARSRRCEFSRETSGQAEQAALDWLQARLAGNEPDDSTLPSVAFGISCAQASWSSVCRRRRISARRRCAPAIRTRLFEILSALPGEKVAKVKVGAV